MNIYAVEDPKTADPKYVRLKNPHSLSNVNNKIYHCNFMKSHRFLLLFILIVLSKTDETNSQQKCEPLKLKLYSIESV